MGLTIYAGVPFFLGLWVGGWSYPNFLAASVIRTREPTLYVTGLPGKGQQLII